MLLHALATLVRTQLTGLEPGRTDSVRFNVTHRICICDKLEKGQWSEVAKFANYPHKAMLNGIRHVIVNAKKVLI